VDLNPVRSGVEQADAMIAAAAAPRVQNGEGSG
jgi:hypothetical protein